jgi:hypothetical protein
MRSLAIAALILAGCEDSQIGRIDPVLSVTPSSIDFGVVELGQPKVEIVTLKNLENVDATIMDISIEDDCEGCFLELNQLAVIGPFVEYGLEVRFRPHRLEVATATLTVTSDDPKAPVHRVTMIGRGIDTRKPCIEVTPSPIDFGFVPSGGIAVRSFNVRSCGTNDLQIDWIQVGPADAPFRVTTATPTPEKAATLAPGAQASAGIAAEVPATVSGTVTGNLVFVTNVVEELNVPGRRGVLSVPLVAIANLPPVAECGKEQTVEPWSRVTLDGSTSHDQDVPPDHPLLYRWSLIGKPGGSTATLERATTPMPSFWADLTGTYEVQLIVTDSLGLDSDPVTCLVEALPTNAIRIELTWDHPDSDVDLHLWQDGIGNFCECNDTHYRDCGRAPNWFPATPGANPRLDVDDRGGFGPENINIDGDGPDRFIPDGRYQIAVHYYASNAEVSTWPTSVSNATVRVYIFGLLAGELTHPLMTDNDLWYAGQIEWPGGIIHPSETVISGQICGVF